MTGTEATSSKPAEEKPPAGISSEDSAAALAATDPAPAAKTAAVSSSAPVMTVTPSAPAPAAMTSESLPAPVAVASAAATSVPTLPSHYWTQAPENPFDDGDSGFSGAADSTTSLTSSILRYRTIQGRTYHSEIGDAQYWGSNDEAHNESLDILHHVMTLCLEGKLFLAPITEPKKVLDIGTGTGLWAIDFADEFPASDVIGTDVSPIQPTWVPPNLRFQIEDCTQSWSFSENEFDYIHIRYMVGSIANWHALFKEAYRCLKPGGWLESYEGSPNLSCDNGTIPPTTAMGQWGPLFVDGGRIMGRSFTVVEDETQRKAMQEAGFLDIQEEKIKVPTGSWPTEPRQKEIGQLSRLCVTQDAEGFILFLTGVLGWPREQVDVFIAHVRKELRVGAYDYYSTQRVVWGRKPEASF